MVFVTSVGLRLTIVYIYMKFIVRTLQELARERETPLHACFIDLQKTYDNTARRHAPGWAALLAQCGMAYCPQR